MTIYLGADHGGFPLKEQAKTWLKEWDYQFQDLGAHELDPQDDYPDFTFPVAEQVAKEADQGSLGVLLCRSSGGVTIAANKVLGARAVSAFSPEEASHAKEHNNANILALAGDFLSDDQAKEILKIFLETPFSGAERHVRRLGKIADYEHDQMKG